MLAYVKNLHVIEDDDFDGVCIQSFVRSTFLDGCMVCFIKIPNVKNLIFKVVQPYRGLQLQLFKKNLFKQIISFLKNQGVSARITLRDMLNSNYAAHEFPTLMIVFVQFY